MSKDDTAGEAGSAHGYEVGYGKPPKATRFGVRPQPLRAKRPPTSDRPGSDLDLAALLDRPIVANINGRRTKLHLHEAMLHGLFRRAVAGEIRAMKLFLQECKRAKLLEPPPQQPSSGVIQIPSGVPIELGSRLVRLVGLPPWDEETFSRFKVEYERDVAHLKELKEQAKAMYREQNR
ncbi:hypothetical protein [Bradyrhizobium sp. Leo121]|uniref:hypothetical protein n=1 Tax=Bradyrhizobium sp. Leo121 TaxID=1571195 RepID=UPI0010293E50|nr:hypothetical protein [Bradyrhizobium sp. Leo121]